ncbi:hypothetical protein D1007_22184 [Hordeum vulgare]|nr:hypothetical protein D1007_22184 [Hordeum vulgare]
MAKASNVSPTLNPNISLDDDDNDEESYNMASLKFKGQMIFKSLYNNKHARSNFKKIMSIATEGKKYIEELEPHHEEHEATIVTMEGHERDYADEIAELSPALENEQTTKESLDETFALELYILKESHDRALEVANDFRTKNDKLEVAHAKLLEDYEHLKNGSRAIKSLLIGLTESHAQLKDSYAKELAKLPSPLVHNDKDDKGNDVENLGDTGKDDKDMGDRGNEGKGMDDKDNDFVAMDPKGMDGMCTDDNDEDAGKDGIDMDDVHMQGTEEDEDSDAEEEEDSDAEDGGLRRARKRHCRKDSRKGGKEQTKGVMKTKRPARNVPKAVGIRVVKLTSTAMKRKSVNKAKVKSRQDV